MKHTIYGLTCLAVTSTILSACTIGSPSAHEQAMGDSVRQARTLQSVPPDKARSDDKTVTTDGIVAAYGIDRYHQSFARPLPPMNVLNILTGPATGNASAATAAQTAR